MPSYFFNKIYDNILKIRNSFLYSKDIDIYEIKSITKSNSLISSPAAVFDRIELNYGKYDSVLVLLVINNCLWKN